MFKHIHSLFWTQWHINEIEIKEFLDNSLCFFIKLESPKLHLYQEL